MQNTSTKAAVKAKDIATKITTENTTKVAAKVKNVVTKAVTKNTTMSMAADTDTGAVVDVSASSATANYVW